MLVKFCFIEIKFSCHQFLSFLIPSYVEFYQVSLNLIKFERDSVGFTVFFSNRPCATGICWVLLSLIEFNWVILSMLNFTEFYWILLSFTEFYWVLLGFSGFQCILAGFTGFYWVLLGCTGFFWPCRWNGNQETTEESESLALRVHYAQEPRPPPSVEKNKENERERLMNRGDKREKRIETRTRTREKKRTRENRANEHLERRTFPRTAHRVELGHWCYRVSVPSFCTEFPLSRDALGREGGGALAQERPKEERPWAKKNPKKKNNDVVASKAYK